LEDESEHEVSDNLISIKGCGKLKTLSKAVFKRLVSFLVVIMSGTSVGRYLSGEIMREAIGLSQNVEHQGLNLVFSIPNELNKFRIDTFSTKEPETLAWIDGMPRGAVVWDIGANVGLYSCYAAKRRACKVFAFEPSVFNLELLARNIFLNNLTELVTIIPLPLCEALTVNTLNMSTTEWGGALSSFGQDYGYDGQTLNKVFQFRTIGLSMSDVLEFFEIPQPDYIKMDVDGIEHLILRGGLPILKQVQSLLIEINDEFVEQAKNSADYLKGAGLSLTEKSHSEMVEDSLFGSAFNQIWTRNTMQQ